MALSGAHILVIDDHIDLAEDLMEILEADGATVSHASTGAAALSLAAAPFDVALLDVRLPDVTGIELLPKLRASGDGLAEVLLVTGHASIEDSMEAIKAGAYAYILKPFNPDELLVDVERALRQVHSTRESEQLRQSLAERESRLRTLVKTVPALLIEMDASGTILQANPAASHAVKAPGEALINSNWIERFIPVADRADLRALLKVVADEGMELQRESRVVAGPGEATRERYVSWTLSRLHAEDSSPGEAIRIYASGLDTTKMRALERRTRVTEKLAAVGTLAAGLAHEIRNPLNAATLQLRLLERGLQKLPDGGERLNEPLLLVQDELTRLSRLLHEFLTFARPGEIATTQVELVSLCRKVVDLCTPAAQDAKIELSLVTAVDALEVDADHEKLSQVFLNLLNNAIEALRDGGDRNGECAKIKLQLEEEPAGAKVLIQDNGPGIPAANLNRIFEPFFSTKPGGTGLGMAIVHSLVTVHGGTIEVSADPKGTQVELHLPVNT